MFSFSLGASLAKAKPTNGKGPYLDRGTGRATIKSVQSGKPQRNKVTGRDEPTFECKLQIETCTPLADDEGAPHPAGTEVSYFQFEESEMGPGNILGFLMSATGNPQSDFSDELMLDA